MEASVVGSTGGQAKSARYVDHLETYGPHVLEEFLRDCPSPRTILDIGAGSGRDLDIARSVWGAARQYAVEAYGPYVEALTARRIDVRQVNIERDRLPFDDESLDVIIANQVMEHLKEVFWVFHEVARSLSVGGSLLVGVPNLVSLHNRVLSVLGRHASQHKLVSAHVRPFSRKDFELFLDTCFPGGFRVRSFRGSQFYPLPARPSRIAARIFPNAAFSVFFHVEKLRKYEGSFLEHPVTARLETNFFLGHPVADHPTR